MFDVYLLDIKTSKDGVSPKTMGTKRFMAFAGTVMLILVLASLDLSGFRHDPLEDNIKKRLDSLSTFTNYQKVFLHLDKSSYSAGETIWFKSYLLDGVSHLPDKDTGNIYIEMINYRGEIREIRILMSVDGIAAGDIYLPSDLPEGNYVIRAYTDWMRNFDEDYYFTRYLYIHNPDYENIISRRELRRNRRFNRRLDEMTGEYEIAFFPEGGNILEGTMNRIGVKISGFPGNGHRAEGEIIDNKGEVISMFRTGSDGIGSFEISPLKDHSYHAKISVDGGRSKNYDLPVIISDGYSLTIDQFDDKVHITVNTTLRPENPLYSEEVTIIGHTRGIPRYSNTLAFNDGIIETSTEDSMFPSGITHFAVFTNDLQPVAERLIFIDQAEEIIFSTVVSTSGGQEGEYLNLEIKPLDKDGSIVKGSYSVSAVTGGLVKNNYDIVSYILVDSDIKAKVKDPASYFNSDPDALKSMDDFLLTHRWKRFKWENVLAGEMPQISFTPSKGIAFRGRLTDPAKNEGVSYHPVQLMVKSDYNKTFTTNTASGGAFSFNGLIFEGIVDIELSSRRLPDNYPPVFDLNFNSERSYDYKPGFNTRKQRITSRGDQWERVERTPSSVSYAQTLDRDAAPQQYGVPDQTIYIDYETSMDMNLHDVLQNHGSGLYFDGGQVFVRGVRSTQMTSGARFMLDGRFIDPEVFLSKYPGDVERIEIFRGTSTAIFGSRGGTGVILAYSRKPDYRGHEDTMELMLLGYHPSREFYIDPVPARIVSSADDQSVTTILWNPDLRTGTDGTMNVQIPLFSGLSGISLVIQGMGYDGGIGFGRINIDFD